MISMTDELNEYTKKKIRGRNSIMEKSLYRSFLDLNNAKGSINHLFQEAVKMQSSMENYRSIAEVLEIALREIIEGNIDVDSVHVDVCKACRSSWYDVNGFHCPDDRGCDLTWKIYSAILKQVIEKICKEAKE